MEAKQVRWHDEDYLRVVRAGLAKKNSGPLAVLKAGQVVLPRDRRMDAGALELRVKAKSGAWWDTMYERAAQLPEVAAQPVKDSDAPKLDAAGRKAKAYWTKLEWARCARLVEQMRQADPGAKLWKLYTRAQLVVIEPDRQKTVSAFSQAEVKGSLPVMHKQGLADVWLLKDEDKAAKAAEQAQQPEEALAPTPFPQTAQEAANNIATAQRLAQAVGDAPAPIHGPSAGASLPPTLAALTIETPGLESALAVFGNQLAQSVGLLIQASQRETRAMIDSKLAAASQRIGQQVADSVQTMVGSIVVKTLTDVLNAPIPVPAPAPMAALPPAASATPAVHAAPAVDSPAAPNGAAGPASVAAPEPEAESKKLRVDVIGLERGDQCNQVLDAVGHIAEVGFVHPDARSAYKPHRGRSVLMMIGRSPHALSAKLKAAKIKPISIGRSVHHVIHAIEELARAKGVQV